MSEIVETAVRTLNERIGSEGLDGSVRLVIEGEGLVRIDEAGAAADPAEADCTMTASAETFAEILAGDLDPTAAFMSGRTRDRG